METGNKTQEENAVTRHCAYCLQLCGFPTKLCGGCKKRAYCSKECQVKDWSNKGNGQRHVNWCRRHECGEEDVDWEVVPIPNKGLGIRAKKLIPSGLKIVIEPVLSSTSNHPEIMNLKGATMEEKFSNNSFRGVNVDQLIHVGVALRNYRVNHACQPNASAIYDDAARVAILFAQKDIQPGEEITICYYTPFFALAPYAPSIRLMIPEFNSIEEELNFFKNLMALEHGITSPTDCFCNDPAILALVREGRQIQSTIMELTNENKIEEALAAGDKVIDIQKTPQCFLFGSGQLVLQPLPYGHCAYCLQLCGFPAKLCGECKKRAYCSKECQTADWPIKGPGQRHVNWCRRHECGEEDVDWEVVPIPNKGLGIRAKKLLTTGMKIIVEPTVSSPNGHPGIMDLEDASLEEKFSKHSFTSVDVGELTQLGVALRSARASHACQPNASKIYDTTARVAVLYALKDIHPGEEITICYYPPCFDLQPFSRLLGLVTSESISIEEEFNVFRELLFSTDGIVCPSNCFCYDPATMALVREGRQIEPTIDKLANQNRSKKLWWLGKS